MFLREIQVSLPCDKAFRSRLVDVSAPHRSFVRNQSSLLLQKFYLQRHFPYNPALVISHIFVFSIGPIHLEAQPQRRSFRQVSSQPQDRAKLDTLSLEHLFVLTHPPPMLHRLILTSLPTFFMRSTDLCATPPSVFLRQISSGSNTSPSAVIN
jgi:hypothetical protein